MKFNSMIQYISAISIAAICLLLASYREWDKTANLAVTKMMGFSPEGDYYLSTRGISSESNISKPELEEYMWEESAYHNLPKNVQRYFHRAFMFTGEKDAIWEDTIKMLRSLELKEEGSLLLKGRWWVPFTSTLHVSAMPMNPGYVHDIQLSIPSPIPFLSDITIYVRNALLNGSHSTEMKMMKVIPVFDTTMLSDLQSGALLRWLSLTPLFPTSLLPHDSDGIQWQYERKPEHDFDKLLRSVQHSSFAQIFDQEASEDIIAEFSFNKNGLIASISGFAPRTNNDNRVIATSPWRCNLFDYEIMGHAMMVPTRVEFGWLEENGEFQPYYKSNFKSFNYTYF